MREELYQVYVLENGIHVLHKEVTHTKIAHCGFIFDIGSRDEKENQQGLAHFWEHLVFKGTQKRNAYHIINRLESVGGEINAFTEKEKICFYASFLEQHYEKAIELLTDISFHATFPEAQMDRERQVILDEMSIYADAPEDAIQDEFDSIIFKDHSLGNNILGTKESVLGFQREDLVTFIHENLDTNRVIFSSVGNIPFAQIKKWADKYLSDIPTQTSSRKKIKCKEHQTQKVEKKVVGIQQCYSALGTRAYALNHNKRLTFFMLSNILGGNAMNSRLNLALREKNGLVYSVDANYQTYTDTGMFSIYYATEQKNLAKTQKLVSKEIQKLKNTKLGIVQLHQAKEQILGQLAMAEESNLGYMLMMGKSMLDLGCIEPIEDIFEAVRKITAEELIEVANEILEEEAFSSLIYIPSE